MQNEEVFLTQSCFDIVWALKDKKKKKTKGRTKLTQREWMTLVERKVDETHRLKMVQMSQACKHIKQFWHENLNTTIQ